MALTSAPRDVLSAPLATVSVWQDTGNGLGATWSRPVAPMRPSSPVPESGPQMPMMVPTDQLLSTMDEPSSGSQHTVKCPVGLVSTTSGSSSDAPYFTVLEFLHAACQDQTGSVRSSGWSKY